MSDVPGRGPEEDGRVEHLADLDAAADEILTSRVDVGDD
jgi:hypothetical protein